MWPFKKKPKPTTVEDIVTAVVEEIFDDKVSLGRTLSDHYDLLVGMAYHRINDHGLGGMQKAGAYALARKRIKERLGKEG